MIRVLVVDDHELVRRGVHEALGRMETSLWIDEACDGEEALRLARVGGYALIVLDLNMPGRGGLSTLEQLACLDPKPRVLVLSMHPEEQYALRALKLGAAGYLNKSSAASELIKAFRRVMDGHTYVSEELAERLAWQLGNTTAAPPHETLSDREFQVMHLLVSGRSVTQIGQQLHLSVKTISTYRARIFDKIGVDNLAALTRYALRQGLID